MKRPFTIYFSRAGVPLTQVADPPFLPQYPMAFVPEDKWVNLTGPGCDLILREHDGYNVYVAVLEVQLDNPHHSLTIPVESLLHDLHMVYQLSGNSEFPGLALPAGHHTQIYAPPTQGNVLIKVDPETHRYAVCTIVPKGKWVSRDIDDTQNPLFQLIMCLKEGHRQFRYLPATSLSSHVRAWIHLLLTARPSPHLMMDNALTHPLGNLLEIHLSECGQQKRHEEVKRKNNALVDSARTMVVELLGRLKDGELPELEGIARQLGTTADVIRKLHYENHQQKFNHYVVRCRIDEAKRRLSHGDSIGSITFALGWTDDTHFVKQFKKHAGMTPGEFLKTLQN